ncbi:GNAT family N-acetyltransferase [[Limnothrix rosea] IAM M-220]|uniref:GNAT family N-acetyltransferase n=1 Tax=[Limnothrix rosea] IAM M-220 TaxID=454133 RepID=UPI000959F9A6|nr:GNAT family N-acetyltransferase [[Limnothrix rosea] IAM M-220]OKH18472.1 GNAT family N-acetyltransferase [[Limnothrix rosea] IAM M-220]
MGNLSRPEKLNIHHDLSSFCSGVDSLDQWLKTRASKNEQQNASRTYVVCDETQVVGYYCLAAGAIATKLATGKVKRNMPNPIPVMIIGRLAIDQNWQGQGLGKALLRDAILRVLQAADIAGVRAVLVHAISEQAKHFYEACGFAASPIEPMTLMITVGDARKALES